jgi:uncharacterized protein with ATP-grasp and redox domains
MEKKMKLSAMCIRCLMDRQEERVRECGDEEKKAVYLKEAAGIIASSGEGDSAPYLVFQMNQAYERLFGKLMDYKKEKKEFNSLMLDLESELEEKIRSGKSREEILKNAINYARSGNYIDFGALNHVDKDELMGLLEKAGEEDVDGHTFAMLSEDLDKAEELVYLLDNCGEIVADKLLVKVLKEQYPNMNITVMVRGVEVLNDAVMEDAEEVGLTKLVKVIGNGNGVAGTQVDLLSREAREAIEKADIIISKGQGNFETIYGGGWNIYYLFLCKCAWFSERFGMERLKGVFINEKDVRV